MIYFDLETAPNLVMTGFLPEIKAPANYKDEEKIGLYIQREVDEQIAKMALDPDLGQITTASFYDDKYSVRFVGEFHTNLLKSPLLNKVEVSSCYNEEALLVDIWAELAKHQRIVGYNILGFDFPYLMRRSMAYGIKLPFTPNLVKFRTDGRILDLFAILYNWGIGKGLKKVRDIYGLTNAYPEVADAKGETVGELSLEDRLKYAVNDVHLCRQLYKRMSDIYFNA